MIDINKLERYEPDWSLDNKHEAVSMFKKPNGEWVKFSDIQSIVASAQAQDVTKDKKE